MTIDRCMGACLRLSVRVGRCAFLLLSLALFGIRTLTLSLSSPSPPVSNVEAQAAGPGTRGAGG